MTTAIYKLVPNNYHGDGNIFMYANYRQIIWILKQFIWIKSCFLSWSEEVYYYGDYHYYNELVKQVITKLMLLLTNK